MGTMRVTTTTEITAERCCVCWIPFGIAEDLRQERLKDGKSFYCPNGHSMSYTEPENTRLRKQVERLEAKLVHAEDQRKAAEAAAANARADEARVRRRVAKGVCPCCHRSFVNLTRHMATKHPEEAAG